MTPLLQAALDFQTFLDCRAWRHCIIGGIALLRWGEPRFTRYVDVTLLCGFGREDESHRAPSRIRIRAAYLGRRDVRPPQSRAAPSGP